MNAFDVAKQPMLSSIISLACEHAERVVSVGSERMDAQLCFFSDGSVLTIDYMQPLAVCRAYHGLFSSNWGWLVDKSRDGIACGGGWPLD